MSEYRAITITQGSGGFGGPLTVDLKKEKMFYYISQVVEQNLISYLKS